MAINEVHIITEELAETTTLDTQFGKNGDVAINKPLGIIYQKQSGAWVQIFP